MSRLRWLSVALSFVLVAAAAHAQEDEEGCKDHPLFSRMPGYSISACEDQEFGAHEFELPDGYKSVEGRYSKLDFALQEGARKPGPLQIGRNYWNAMAPKGATKLFESFDAGGGTLVAHMPAPNGGGTVWVELYVANSAGGYTLHVVQETAMRQDVQLTARELADALASSGSVTLDNILFDTGRATIRPESEAPLATVRELLESDPTLKLEIQGHTDNMGGRDANLKLSRDRAEAVKAHLVAGGVSASRLTTAGFGDAQPVADNASEEGRARNRRVVLVKKP
jgi:outer membrane protein OmpA-like peptidoglycan-associated protein